MKLSSHRELLKQADDELIKIRETIMKEQPWTPEDYKNQRSWVKRKPLSKLNVLEKYLKEKTSEIEGRYYNADTEESKQAEIEELKKLVETLKRHLLDNWKEIPEDQEKQSEIEKIITNAPKLPDNFDFKRNYAKAFIQDPKTGMWWNRAGYPVLPPDWSEIEQRYRYDALGIGRESEAILHDKTKPLIYRLIKSFFTWNTNPTTD